MKQEPDAVEAIVILGAALAAEGQVEEAISRFEQALELEPQNAPDTYSSGLGDPMIVGSHGGAVAHLNEAIRLWSGSVPMLWQTAWILATSPDPSSAMGPGARAGQASDRAFRRPRGAASMRWPPPWPKPSILCGRRASEQASTMALARDDAALADAIDQRTRLYRQGFPIASRRRLSPLDR